MSSLTYVYCVVSAARAPHTRGAPRGLRGMGAPRVLHVDGPLFAIVADAPAKRYDEAAVNSGLADLDWVSRAAVAHEAVVEHFIEARAVLPMKLFTMFASDDRALAHLRRERLRLAAAARRVAGQLEWGLRVLLDTAGAQTDRASVRARRPANEVSGIAYLTAKRLRRNAATELATRARRTAADLYDRLAKNARAARKRTGRGSAQDGQLLLDAAFLVPRSRVTSFRRLAAREAKTLGSEGYVVMLTGPWPPYTFVQD